MLKITTIDLLRHGDVEGAPCFRGRLDVPLTERGVQRMQRQCADGVWEVLISSPLQRCLSFASAWSRQHGSALQVDPSWMEIDFGAWEGQNAETIETRFPGALQTFYANPGDYTPPGGEAYADFIIRLQRAWDAVVDNHAGNKVLIVTHAGVIRALFCLLLGVPAAQSQQISVPYACLSRFCCFADHSGKYVQLMFHKPD